MLTLLPLPAAGCWRNLTPEKKTFLEQEQKCRKKLLFSCAGVFLRIKWCAEGWRLALPLLLRAPFFFPSGGAPEGAPCFSGGKQPQVRPIYCAVMRQEALVLQVSSRRGLMAECALGPTSDVAQL